MVPARAGVVHMGARVPIDGTGVVPARAGVVPRRSRRRWVPRSGPRACGGGPCTAASGGSCSMWSPRVRGWSPWWALDRGCDSVVPARAGVVPAGRRSDSAAAGGPRACGGGPTRMAPEEARTVWSPRVRGWSPGLAQGDEQVGVVPARAGVVPCARPSRRRMMSGPRACGGGPSRFTIGISTCPVVPARAGVVPVGRKLPHPTKCGPRACGGGPRPLAPGSTPPAWSPRVRGWSRQSPGSGRAGRVVPARAGVVPQRPGPGAEILRGPRACGGGPDHQGALGAVRAWSPRVRGWSLHVEAEPVSARVVPARAGVVPSGVKADAMTASGPRACGGGPQRGEGGCDDR